MRFAAACAAGVALVAAGGLLGLYLAADRALARMRW